MGCSSGSMCVSRCDAALVFGVLLLTTITPFDKVEKQPAGAGVPGVSEMKHKPHFLFSFKSVKVRRRAAAAAAAAAVQLAPPIFKLETQEA